MAASLGPGMMGPSMNLTTISGMLAFAATTGIISAALTQAVGVGRDLHFERRMRRTLATYHALRLAVILETYAYACASFITKNSNAPELPDYPYPAWNTDLPELAPYPAEADGWHAIDVKLAARALALRNRIVGSQGIIDGTAEYAEQDLEETLDEHAAARGQEAWALANDLRRAHKVPPFEPVWDFTEALKSAQRSAEHAKSEREKLIAAAARAMSAS